MANLIGTDYLMGEVMQVLEFEVRAAQNKTTNFVPVIVGDPGTGKSKSIEALAEKMNMAIAIFSLGALPMEWFSGLPEFGTETIDPKYSVEKKTEIRTTEWTMSDLIRSINVQTENAMADGREGMIVLLDDIHLVEPIIQKYLFEFFQNKTLQNFKIHENAHFIGAMNGKDSAGLEGFLSAVLNRMALYFTKFDKDFWYHNVSHMLHPYMASFATGPNDKYFTGANSTDGASPSPRAWTELSLMIPDIEEHAKGKPSEINPLLQIIAEARVGREAAIEFMKHVKIFQKFDFDSVLEKKDPKLTISTDTGDQILMAFIIRYMKTKEDAEYVIDILNHNRDRRTFISVFINEFDILFKGIHKMPEGKTKVALTELSNLITDEDKIDSELIDIVVDGLLDIS